MKILLKVSMLLVAFSIFAAPAKEYSDIFDNVSVRAKTIQSTYFGIRATQWGERLSGVYSRIDTPTKVIALTFDACGGKNGSGVDAELISYLIKNKIKATLFVNARWIILNKELFLELAANELFDIENHGLEHRPLSVSSREVYGISGAGSPAKVVYEVEVAAQIIERLTGRKPVYFRSGTAYYDNVALQILESLGYKAVAFSINADKGATLLASEVEKRLLAAKAGDIIIAHMNRPSSGTRAGFEAAIPQLTANGFKFVKLSEVTLK